jgi:mRNA interferase RelE/StbE
MYSVRLVTSATKDLAKLDRDVAGRIVDRLEWLSKNLPAVRLFPLRGDLAGLYKIREGPYRIIFEIVRSENLIIVHAIGHRRDVYKRR